MHQYEKSKSASAFVFHPRRFTFLALTLQLETSARLRRSAALRVFLQPWISQLLMSLQMAFSADCRGDPPQIDLDISDIPEALILTKPREHQRLQAGSSSVSHYDCWSRTQSIQQEMNISFSFKDIYYCHLSRIHRRFVTCTNDQITEVMAECFLGLEHPNSQHEYGHYPKWSITKAISHSQ